MVENKDNMTEQASRVPEMYNITMEDSNWIMTSAFIIFTMQTGFGMLESGCVSLKNEANIMMKNVVDIFLGGATYWLFGYGLQFGYGPFTTPFLGIGDFAVDKEIGDKYMGATYTAFLFQLSFATTATTIVSGAMAERCNFKAYCVFSFLNTVVYCVPAGWVWGKHGFLNNLGAVDIAGSGCVHLIGGFSAFASAMMLGPRLGRYADGIKPLPLGTPVNCAMGLFVLWWGWLAFNSGSTYGVSGQKWEYAAKASVMTMLASFGGGCVGLFYTIYENNGLVIIMDLINSVLGALVSITAGCFLYSAWESILVGCVGGILSCVTMPWFDMIGVDDPVGASSVHGICGIWGMIAVGLFAQDPKPLSTTSGRQGLFRGGGWHLLAVQTLTCICLGLWSLISTICILWMVNKLIPIRMPPHQELLGADLAEHLIRHSNVGVSRALSQLQPLHPDTGGIHLIQNIGSNPGHEAYLCKYVKQHLMQLQTISAHTTIRNKLDKLTEYNSRDSSNIPHYAWVD